jgi:hypothetical protein
MFIADEFRERLADFFLRLVSGIAQRGKDGWFDILRQAQYLPGCLDVESL